MAQVFYLHRNCSETSPPCKTCKPHVQKDQGSYLFRSYSQTTKIVTLEGANQDNLGFQPMLKPQTIGAFLCFTVITKCRHFVKESNCCCIAVCNISSSPVLRKTSWMYRSNKRFYFSIFSCVCKHIKRALNAVCSVDYWGMYFNVCTFDKK